MKSPQSLNCRLRGVYGRAAFFGSSQAWQTGCRQVCRHGRPAPPPGRCRKTCGMTRIPRLANRASNGQEIAPQTSTSTPSSASRPARSCGPLLLSLSVSQRSGSSESRSTRRICSATSNTGETRPCQSGTAIFIGTPLRRFLEPNSRTCLVRIRQAAVPQKPSDSGDLFSVFHGLAPLIPLARRQSDEG